MAAADAVIIHVFRNNDPNTDAKRVVLNLRRVRSMDQVRLCCMELSEQRWNTDVGRVLRRRP